VTIDRGGTPPAGVGVSADTLPAANVTVEDVAGLLAATDAEAALAEIATDIDNHIADAAAAHAASAISVADAGGLLAATEVEAALAEIATDIDNHIADTADAHDASAISVADAGGLLAATEVEAALAEIATEIDDHIADAAAAHAASAVSFTPAGGVAATDAQAAIEEVDSEKVAKAGDTMTGDLVVTSVLGSNAAGAALIGDEAASSTNPTVIPNQTYDDSGLSVTTDGGVGSETWGIIDSIPRIQYYDAGFRVFAEGDNGVGGPSLHLKHARNLVPGDGNGGADTQSASQNNDGLALIHFDASNDASQHVEYMRLSGKIVDVTDGGEQGNIYLYLMGGVTAGTLSKMLDVYPVGGSPAGQWNLGADQFRASNAAGPTLVNEASSGTNPTLCPSRADTDTGLGVAAANTPSLIGGGTELLRLASGAVTVESAAAWRTALGLGTVATQAANNVAITGGSVAGITDVAVADGGTGASNAADARTNLGCIRDNGVSEIQLIRKTSDETVNNSTTLQNDDELSFSIAANEVILLELVVFYNSSTGADINMVLTGPSGVSGTMLRHDLTPSATANTDDRMQARDPFSSFNSGGVGSNVGMEAKIVITNGGTAGTIQLQWAQDVAEVSDTKVLANSYMYIRRAT